ncbi:flavin monoamine oxidase family protein [Rhodohalobacter sulfatireducens]|uniref:FAD-dependent oxidoreductase n=1 Tax=Rhodohalobacter sulfatireducens TaxID=2911366 RepID=A0ABS9KJ98_9BACT|nr:NAD(P)/FAD-dependent oxidoreductase [Rhodohalobacter sulfatireducens]MCG2590911.1 FAD-dependent oxidoreductase [Rhodohalobacter sulfatireducens]
MQTPNITILGGGLSGLLTAYLLKKEGFTSQILEARSRLGGRIYTFRPGNEASVELGATWLGKKHRHLVGLLNEMKIDIYEQHMGRKAFYEPMSVSPPQLVDLPPNDEPSYRIKGGTDRIIQVLAEQLDQNQIHCNQVVKKLRKKDDRLEIQTGRDHFEADLAISTLPPKLLVSEIDFFPALPKDFVDIASKTHTWMAESIKIAFTFEDAFWRKSQSSGTIFSNVGPVHEMYDHSFNNQFALKGFMDNAYHSISRKQRKELVLEQLRRFYGGKVDSFISYHECIWQKEPYTFSSYLHPVIPHQHNGHSIFQKTFLDKKLLIGGSETATEFPGYMDGAVESAYHAVEKIKELLS